MRAHGNFVEMLPMSIVFTAVTGLLCPWFGAACGITIVLGRFFYTIGYVSKPESRLVGALLNDLGLLVAMVASVIGALKVTQVI